MKERKNCNHESFHYCDDRCFTEPKINGHSFDIDKPDLINHPDHYNSLESYCDQCGKQIECIFVVRHMSFNIGNAIKYLWRCDHKGNAIEDLKKAAWYIQDEIKKREKNESK